MATVVLQTGGAGFFGRRIAEKIREAGYELVTPDLPDFNLMDYASVEKAVKEIGPEIVVHPAAYYGGLGICMREPANLFYRNVIMIANILEASSKVNIKRFVSVGSACAYPGNVVGDMKEDDFWSGALHPSVEAYGFTKKVQQVGGRAYQKQYGTIGQYPQITNLYGENDVFTEYRSHVVAALIKRYANAVASGADQVMNWGTGSAVREFMYTHDGAEAIVKLMETDFDDTLNIGSGIGTTIKELATLVAELTGFEGEVAWDTDKPDGVPRKVLDVTRMKEVLNWEPPTSLRDGLKKTIDWYLANKEEADARQ
ncbi:GDP-L-fucose synthase [bacterium BMS3Bbin04]|nr:GDP-L-fucose synthase [bacterium BMS3Bbin04]